MSVTRPKYELLVRWENEEKRINEARGFISQKRTGTILALGVAARGIIALDAIIVAKQGGQVPVRAAGLGTPLLGAPLVLRVVPRARGETKPTLLAPLFLKGVLVRARFARARKGRGQVGSRGCNKSNGEGKGSLHGEWLCCSCCCCRRFVFVCVFDL